MTIRLAQFGFVVRHIFSYKDPKTYIADDINAYLLGLAREIS